MPGPTDQHLYIMQNEHCVLKIGRSVDPEKRRRQVELSEGCRLAIVWISRNMGHREEDIHIQMGDFWIDGEWFDGSPEARSLALRAIDCDDPVKWPYAYDAKLAERWIEELSERRDRKWARQRFFCHIEHVYHGPSTQADEMVLMALRFIGALKVEWRTVKRKSLLGFVEDGKFVPCPAFTTDMAASMTVWPEGERPATFEGSPLECAIEALKAHHRLMPPVKILKPTP